jgi:hypothetical protein
MLLKFVKTFWRSFDKGMVFPRPFRYNLMGKFGRILCMYLVLQISDKIITRLGVGDKRFYRGNIKSDWMQISKGIQCKSKIYEEHIRPCQM